MSFLDELKRRNVIRVAIAYVAVSWLVLQVASLIVQVLELPNAVSKVVFAVLVIGFIPALVFSWLYELTPEGLKREDEVDRSGSITRLTGRRLDYLVIGVLGAVVALLLIDKFVVAPRQQEKGTEVIKSVDQAGSPGSKADLITSVPFSKAAATAAAPASIAVLPFVDMSQARDQEYFSDGLSEELLNLLAKTPDLKVIARTSSFSFKGKEVDIATIAKALNVANVLEGSVRKSGNTLRITAQLIRTADSTHLWSETYDRELTDVFKVQDEIAQAVVSAMKLKLLGAQTAPAQSHATSNVEAYNQYLLGKQLYNRINKEGWKQSRAALERAIALDPGYAAAWAALSDTLTPLSDFLDTPEEIERAKRESIEAAEKAIGLAPDLADGYAARSYLRAAITWDFRGSEADIDKALALDPGSKIAQRRRGELLATVGRVSEAVTAMRELIASDPLNDQYWTNLCAYLMGIDLDAAREAGAHATALNPTSTFAIVNVGYVELLDGKPEAARAAFDRLGDFWAVFGRALVEHKLGHKEAAQAALDEYIRFGSYGAAYQIAELHAWRGEPTQAFEWLERAIAQRDGGVPYLKFDQFFKPLRGDPRYAAILKKLGLPA